MWKILEPLGFLADEVQVVRHHREHFDGTGYPDDLTGEAIPLGGPDHRGGRRRRRHDDPPTCGPAGSWYDAVAELRRCAGTQFDPAAVTAFQEWLAATHSGEV